MEPFVESQLSKDDWVRILNDKSITSELGLSIFQSLYSFENFKAPASQVGLVLGYSGKSSHAPINAEIGRYAKRIANYFDIQRSQRSQQKYRYWDLFFRGEKEGRFFAWQLRPELVEALRLTSLTGEEFFPEELTGKERQTYVEGSKRSVIVNAYERNPVARQKCIEHWGASCTVCEFCFEDIYGELGQGFIHVHHLIPVSQMGSSYQVNPVTDMRPVCPNCHAMLHKQNPPLTIEGLQKILLDVRSENLESHIGIKPI